MGKPRKGAETPKKTDKKKPRPRKRTGADGPTVEPEAELTCTSRGLQTVWVIRCPRCRSDRCHKNGIGAGVCYYKCLRCRTRFKAVVRDGFESG